MSDKVVKSPKSAEKRIATLEAKVEQLTEILERTVDDVLLPFFEGSAGYDDDVLCLSGALKTDALGPERCSADAFLRRFAVNHEAEQTREEASDAR